VTRTPVSLSYQHVVNVNLKPLRKRLPHPLLALPLLTGDLSMVFALDHDRKAWRKQQGIYFGIQNLSHIERPCAEVVIKDFLKPLR
jgi:hypothetical protein